MADRLGRGGGSRRTRAVPGQWSPRYADRSGSNDFASRSAGASEPYDDPWAERQSAWDISASDCRAE